MSERDEREHRIATIAMLVVCLGAGLAIALVSGIWMLFPAPLLLVASVWASSTSRSRFRPKHPTFLDMGELLGPGKNFSFRYPTLLAFVVMASGVGWAAVRIMEAYPKQKFAFVVFLFFATPIILYVSFLVEVAQRPKRKKDAEDRDGKPDA